jgi:hypothetical protein
VDGASDGGVDLLVHRDRAVEVEGDSAAVVATHTVTRRIDLLKRPSANRTRLS